MRTGVARLPRALLLGTCALACAAPEPSRAPAAPGSAPPAGNLLHAPLSEAFAPGREVWLDVVVLPPHGTLERHWHAGEEFLYGLQGEFEVAFDDGTSVRGGPGQAGHVPFRTWHRAVAGAEGARVLVFRVHTAGEPLRSTGEIPQAPNATPAAATAAAAAAAATHGDEMKATKPSDREILLTRSFAAPPDAVFAALTQPEQIRAWMKPSALTLVDVAVDLRVGGSLLYVFARPGGRRLEVRGRLEAVSAPDGFVYAESYDFSPLKVHVTTALEEHGGKTRFTQRMRYATQAERDEDYPGVASSAKEAYDGLERYLARTKD